MDQVLDRLSRENERLDTPRYTYAIGDVQGCFDDLLRLLDKINFDPAKDQLWFTGDLVNKGPNSLNILRFVKGLRDAAVTVLGNHDLHLLAVAAGAVKDRKSDTIASILAAHDCDELLFWLRHQPVLHHDDALGYTMVHAGLPPQWGLDAASAHARELESILQNPGWEAFLAALYEESQTVGTRICRVRQDFDLSWTVSPSYAIATARAAWTRPASGALPPKERGAPCHGFRYPGRRINA